MQTAGRQPLKVLPRKGKAVTIGMMGLMDMLLPILVQASARKSIARKMVQIPTGGGQLGLAARP